MFGMDDPYDHGGQVFGGVGQRLVPEGQPGNDDNHHQRSVRDLACKYSLILCMLGNFTCFCCHLTFQNELFSKNSFRNTLRVSNSLDPDQD